MVGEGEGKRAGGGERGGGEGREAGGKGGLMLTSRGLGGATREIV